MQQWSSNKAYILSIICSAVGLGNIWKFPYIVGENGGGAFLIIYLLFLVVVGVPLIMSEMIIGHLGRGSPAKSFDTLAKKSESARPWYLIGHMASLAGFLIFTYYSVVLSWIVYYFQQSITNVWTEINPDAISAHFEHLLENPLLLLFLNAFVILTVLFISILGIRKGFENIFYTTLLILVLLLGSLLVLNFNSDSFLRTIEFLLYPDFSKLNARVILAALGHAFFTIGIALGSIIVFSSYSPTKINVVGIAFTVIVADTLIALITAFVVFPVVFQYNLSPDQGVGLFFQTLPHALRQMPYNWFFATLLFGSLFFVGFSSAIAQFEPALAWVKERLKIKRAKASVLVSFFAFLLSIPVILSFNVMRSKQWLGMTYYQWLDFVTANIMLPFGALLTAIFIGWVCTQSNLRPLFFQHAKWVYTGFLFFIRYITPIFILTILLSTLA